MQIVRKQAYARAGLVGNPSDGYHGKTIAITVCDFSARVVLYEWEDVEIVLSGEDRTRFGSIGELAEDVQQHGYYGGARLIKATIKKFYTYCCDQGEALNNRNFSIRYESDIPRQVGLAGSSAIIVATLRCLMAFYEISIPLAVQPSLVREVETKELKIAAGLQDRVIQVYEGLVYMDFSGEQMQNQDGFEHGCYERMDPAMLPPLYLAFSTNLSQPTEVMHDNLRLRYEQGTKSVLDAMDEFARLAADSRDALRVGDAVRLSCLMDENFDLRCAILPIPAGYVQMVEVARSVGCSAKFAGSGGAIVGAYEDDAMFEKLKTALARISCYTIKPKVAANL